MMTVVRPSVCPVTDPKSRTEERSKTGRKSAHDTVTRDRRALSVALADDFCIRVLLFYLFIYLFIIITPKRFKQYHTKHEIYTYADTAIC